MKAIILVGAWAGLALIGDLGTATAMLDGEHLAYA